MKEFYGPTLWIDMIPTTTVHFIYELRYMRMMPPDPDLKSASCDRRSLAEARATILRAPMASLPKHGR